MHCFVLLFCVSSISNSANTYQKRDQKLHRPMNCATPCDFSRPFWPKTLNLSLLSRFPVATVLTFEIKLRHAED